MLHLFLFQTECLQIVQCLHNDIVCKQKPSDKGCTYRNKIIYDLKSYHYEDIGQSEGIQSEKETFLVEVGSSSQDIRLKDEYKVTEDGWLEGTDRGFYAKAYKEADRT